MISHRSFKGVVLLKGYNEFVDLFGDVTVLQITKIVLAIIFIIIIYKKIKKFFVQKSEEQYKCAELEKTKNEQIKVAIDAIEMLKKQILELKTLNQETSSSLKKMDNRLTDMEESTKRRERNKIRDRLLHNYRHYTNTENNPSQSWTEMEADAFWELFREYEDAGGDGYMHTDVQPAMLRLHVIKKEY